MSRETWEILQQMEPKDVELQLAPVCAVNRRLKAVESVQYSV